MVYAFILVTLVRGGESARRTALVCCAGELAGVLVVGTLTIVVPSAFQDQTVWSYYGADYLFIPLVLPVTGILWLRGAAAPRPEEAAGQHQASRARRGSAGQAPAVRARDGSGAGRVGLGAGDRRPSPG